MSHPNTTLLLKEKIRQKEIERAAELFLLKEQMKATVESLRPINLIKEALVSPDVQTSAVDTAIGMTSGYLVKKAVVRSSNNILLKVIGNLVGMGVSNIVSKHPGGIKTLGGKLLNTLLKKTKTDTENV